MNWVYASAAIVAGVLTGLYIVGKTYRKHDGSETDEPKIKVKGKNFDDLVRKLKVAQNQKNIVDFEIIPSFSYESLVNWIKQVDIQDIDKEAANYGCMIVRSSAELDQFNLDISKLSAEQKNHIFGALIVNLESQHVIAQRWIICELDDDLLSVFGDDNIKILK